MTTEHEELDYAALIEALVGFVRERRTGTMFIATESQHSARISLERGRIVSCSYYRYRGLDAIIQIRHIQRGSCKFLDGVFNSAAETPLPETDELLRDLGIVASPSAAQRRPAPAQAPSTGHTTAASTKPASGAGGRNLWEIVVKELTVYLGPVAPIAAAEYRESLLAATSTERIRSILAKLALEIPDSQQARDFKSRVEAKLTGA